MKPTDALKISVLSGLILVIFSLPTLTATQLVGVLGTQSSRASLIFRPISDQTTFTSETNNQFNVSFQLPTTHIFALVTNPADTRKSFTLQILNPGRVPLGSKITFGGNPISGLKLSTSRLAGSGSSIYNSSADLTIGPHTSVPLAIDTTSSDPDHGTIILSVSED